MSPRGPRQPIILDGGLGAALDRAWQSLKEQEPDEQEPKPGDVICSACGEVLPGEDIEDHLPECPGTP